MMEWNDIEHLAIWVMEKRFKDYNHDTNEKAILDI